MIADIPEDKGKALGEELGEHVAFVKLDVMKADEWENAIKKNRIYFQAR